MRRLKECCCDAARARDEAIQGMGGPLLVFLLVGFAFGWLLHAYVHT